MAGANIAPGQFPTVEKFKQFLVTDLKKVETLKWSLYDSLVMPLAGSTNLRFFQNPQGQGLSASPGNANNPKVLSDTNMQLAGALPKPQGFWCESIEIDFQPGSSASDNTFAIRTPSAFDETASATVQAGIHDVNAFYTGGSLTLTIGQKPYVNEAPLLRFPPKRRFELDAAAASTSTTTGLSLVEKMRSGGYVYELNPGLALVDNMNFDITLNWPVAIALPSGFNGRVQVIMDGWLFRAVQ